MYLLFPNSQTLQVAISSGIIAESTLAAPAEFVAHEDGRIWVQPSKKLTAAELDALKPLGVTSRKSTRGAGSNPQTANCWPQIIPLEESPAGLSANNGFGERVPILFELPESADLGSIVTEMLRLGNDRQSYRQQETPAGVKTLLLVKGPPYYTLLRAIDPTDGEAAPRAYAEQSPGVWVELGFRHPLADQIQPPPGSFLLLGNEREWTAVKEGKFHDIYEALKLTVPGEPARFEGDELEERLNVLMRLVKSTCEDAAEFWVLSDEGVSQLESLVEAADDRLIHRLAFAVGKDSDDPEKRTVVVKVRPGKEPPPVLVLDGVACRSYLRLPNLFLPVGHRLHPPLRRDAVKKLLASDQDQNTWLIPEAGGRFQLQSLPDEAFRPLSDWVDYVLDADQASLSAWSEAMQFDFESFICPDDAPAPSAKPARTRREKARKEEPNSDIPEPSTKPAPAKAKKPAAKKPAEPASEKTAKAVPLPPSELQLRLEELEREFRESTEPMHSPWRIGLWRELAETNMALGHFSEGALCYLNGLWEQDPLPADWIADWFQAETGSDSAVPMAGGEFQLALDADRPSPTQISGLAIHLLRARFSEDGISSDAEANLEKVQKQLRQFENYLPLRLAWFAWLASSRIAGGDVLALARSRDRILERLYDYGPSPEMDLPGFLRSIGPKTGERFRAVKDAIVEVRSQAQSWITRELEAQNSAGQGQTAAYADLMIAYGYARVGLREESDELFERTSAHLQKPGVKNEVHDWFLSAFRHRITQAMEGQSRSGPLPEELIKPLAEKSLDAGTIFIIDSLRSKSRILQPYEQIGSHTRQISARSRGQFDLDTELEHLSDIENREDLAERAVGLLEKHGGETILESFNLELNNQALLTGLLQRGPRLGDAQSAKLLELIPETIHQLNEPEQKAALLEWGIFVAAHFGHPALVRQYIEQLEELLEAAAAPETAEAFGLLLGQTFRGLRKLGMRGELSGLLEFIGRLDEAKRFEVENPAQAKRKKARSPRTTKAQEDQKLVQKMQAMTLRLSLAAGWFYFGNDERAGQIIEDASRFLFGETDLKPLLRRKFARRYASVLELAPTEVAIPRLLEVFTQLRKITKGQGAGIQDEYYAYELLEVVDSVVLAMVSDEMTLDPKTRKIMDELEFSIRRRIHHDLEAAQHTSGA